MAVLPRHTAIPIRIIITPQLHACTTIAGVPGHAEAVVWARDPSAVEAAVLVAAGANAYVTDLVDLAAAVDAVCTGETWFAPVAAAALCRLARNIQDHDFETLAAVARAAAQGRPWPLTCRSAGLEQTQAVLARLRQQL